MTNKKISALTAAATPLAGAEVLPIVQSGATVKVSVSDLTVGRTVLMNAAGVGTTSPLGTLHVQYADGAPNSSGNMTNGAIFGYNPGGYGFQLGTYGAGAYNYVNSAFTNNSGTAASFAVFNGAVENTRFWASGGVSIGFAVDPGLRNLGVSGNVIQGASGKGITTGGAFSLGFGTNASTTQMSLDTSGIVTMSAYGAGAATFSAAGVISSVSDETYKIKDGVIVDPMPMIMALEPGYYYGKPEANMGDGRQLGFYAQNVRAAIGPEAAPDPEPSKPWGYYDRSVLAVAIEAIKVQQTQITALTARIAALEAK